MKTSATTRSRPLRLARALLPWLLSLLLTLGGSELVLRLFPQLVPLPLLDHFSPTLRTRIAIERDLPNTSQVYELRRDDGGPPLLLFKPFSHFTLRFRDAGTVPTMTMDEQGFCNPVPNAYAEPIIDIIAIGDSFTFCQSLPPDAVWSVEVARRLGRTSYNLGRGRIGPYEYLQILKNFGLRKHPRLVILNIYEGNDLRDALRYERYSTGHTRYRSVQPATEPAPADSWLRRNSVLYNLARAAVRSAASTTRPAAAAESDEDEGGEPDPRVNFRYSFRFPAERIAFNRNNTDRDEITLARALRDGTVRLEVFDRALESYVQLARENDFVPVVSYSPSAYTAYAEFVEFKQRDLAGLMSSYSASLRAYFARRGAELGYHFVDETPALQEAARTLGPGRLLYFPYNLHFTPEGHRVVGELLAREIEPLFAAPAAPAAAQR